MVFDCNSKAVRTHHFCASVDFLLAAHDSRKGARVIGLLSQHLDDIEVTSSHLLGCEVD